MNIFYVYIYLDPRKSGVFKYGSYEFNYEPFYVGKGKDERWKDKKNDHCEYKINKIKSSGFETIRMKIIENLEENYSFEVEKELIKLIGKEILNEGPLTNIADGGEGVSGYKWTEEQVKKHRKDFSDIKSEFERRNYQLLTEEKDYENAFTKLEYECPRGHRSSICWAGFQQGHDCPCIGSEKRAKKQRKEYSIIKETFENRDYILLTEEKDYKNCDIKLEYICPKGHKHSITWTHFQEGHNCPYCVKKKIDFSDIKKEFENRDYILLTEEKDYKNCDTKLEYICPKGHKHSITWDSFKQESGCPICGREKQAKKLRKNFPEIKETFEKRNYKLLTEEKDYENAHQKLECICNRCIKKYLTCWGHFQQGKDCRCRTKEKRKISQKLKNKNVGE